MRGQFLRMWLMVSVVAGFATAVFFVITYLNNELLCDMHCRVRNEVTIAIALSALFGMFVGSLTYYLLGEKHKKDMVRLHQSAEATYVFLEPDERKVVRTVIEAGGSILQSELGKQAGMSRVKVSRTLKDLEQRGVVRRRESGMTNDVELAKDLKEVLVR